MEQIYHKQLEDFLPDNTGLHQFDDFPLGHDSVGEVQAAVFPLNGTVYIQSITEPVIGRAPGTKTHSKLSMSSRRAVT